MKLHTKFFIMLVMILLLYSCEPSSNIPTKEQITEIIVETIRQDSLDTNIPICLNLVNRYIYQQEYDKKLGYLPPPPRNRQGQPFVFSLYKSTEDTSLGFIQKDSLFVARQINSNKDITLDSKILPKEIKAKNIHTLKKNDRGWYEFLVPVFNRNKDFAIVEYDYQCAGCGKGRIVFFKKVNRNWIIVEAFNTWQS